MHGHRSAGVNSSHPPPACATNYFFFSVTVVDLCVSAYFLVTYSPVLALRETEPLFEPLFPPLVAT